MNQPKKTNREDSSRVADWCQLAWDGTDLTSPAPQSVSTSSLFFLVFFFRLVEIKGTEKSKGKWNLMLIAIAIRIGALPSNGGEGAKRGVINDQEYGMTKKKKRCLGCCLFVVVVVALYLAGTFVARAHRGQ